MIDFIREQIGQMNQLEDKLILKDLLNGVFIELYEQNQRMYEQLEQRVYEEMDYQESTYGIYTGLVNKNDYDTSHHFLFPMEERDIGKKIHNLEEIMEALHEKEAYFVDRIFLKCDYLLFQEILMDRQPFAGCIVTNRKSYNAWFRMELTTAYWERVYSLYQMFIHNGIPWKTLNIPYISRMVDIYLDRTEEEIPEKEEIKEIKIDFGEYSPYVEYDKIPVWNIKKIQITTTGFPFPCEDHVNFEHTVLIGEYGVKNGFLVETIETKNQIKYVRRNKESLTIVAAAKDSKLWDVFMIARKEKKKLDRFDYPLMSNVKTDSFTEKLSVKNQNAIKTKAELIRFIGSLQLQEYLEFQDLKIIPRKEDNPNFSEKEREETYSMNYFILDEIRDCDYSKRLILYFQAKDRSYFFIRDLLSYIVSEVQLIYEEYHCEGKLI